MLKGWMFRTTLCGVALLAFVGCGGPGLPPAGPAPGEVDVGYGTREEEDLTGAVSSLTDPDTPPGPVRLEELLRGRAAGLEIIPLPEGGYRLQIRGSSALIAQQIQEPLVVVDGVPIPPGTVHTALAGLTRDDIRQVDILKDLASTAIYGTRGAAGVILITTTRR
jgi:iron complex outermembrane receptor protein